MSKLIIVCGLPGTGKTTFANALSKKLNTVCFHKDSIKESLYEALCFKTLEESRLVGAYSMKLLMKLVEEQVAFSTDIIAEAPFTYAEDHKVFEKWSQKYEVDVIFIVCEVEEKERLRRIDTRKRHLAHHDQERDHQLKVEKNLYSTLPGFVMRINTSLDSNELLSQVLFRIKQKSSKIVP